MRRFAAVSALLVLAFVAVRASAQDANPEVIYGDDDRLDIYQVKSAKLLEMADATVSLWPPQGERDRRRPPSWKPSLSANP